MKKTKILALALVLALCLSVLAGCGSTEQSAASGGASSGSASGETSGTAPAASGSGAQPAAETGDAGAGVDDEEEEEDMEEIKITWLTLGPMSAEQTDPVVDAINAITEREINTHVEMEFYDAGTYATRVPMMIQANEKLDLIMYTPIPGSGFQSFKAQGQLLDISGYLDEYGQDVKSILGPLLQGTSSADGGVYGVCCNRILGSYLAIVMRTDVLEELGLLEKAQNMTTWTEYEEILKEVVANTDYAGMGNTDTNGTVMSIVPYFTGEDAFADCKGFDTLGETTHLVYVDEATNQVGSYYESEQYRKGCERAERWYNEGLIYKDAAMSQTFGNALIQQGVCFSVLASAELGVEESYESQTGFDLTFVRVAEAAIGSDATYKFGFAVPVTAQEPEAAVKFLNLLYTNTDLNDILSWGVPGRDWVKVDGCADYPEGVDGQNVQYHMMDIFGNQFITTPWIDNGPDFRQVQQAEQDRLVFSKYMGFAPETADISNEQANCAMVGSQFNGRLSSGSGGNCDAMLASFSQQLQAAGIETIVSAYQAQLDQWLAESGK